MVLTTTSFIVAILEYDGINNDDDGGGNGGGGGAGCEDDKQHVIVDGAIAVSIIVTSNFSININIVLLACWTN